MGNYLWTSTHTPIWHRLVTSKTALFAVQADCGITLTAGAVTTAKDLSGAGHDFTSAGAAAPALTTLGGRAAFNMNSNKLLTCAGLDLPAPGTTPFFLWTLFANMGIPPSGNGCLFAQSGTNTMALLINSGARTLVQFNGSSANTSASLVDGTPVLVEALFNNGTSDRLKVAGSNVTGANAGNSNPAASVTIGSLAAATFINAKVIAMAAWPGAPSAAELAALKAAAVKYVGGLAA